MAHMETPLAVLADHDQDIFGNCLLGLTTAEYRSREVGRTIPPCPHSRACLPSLEFARRPAGLPSYRTGVWPAQACLCACKHPLEWAPFRLRIPPFPTPAGFAYHVRPQSATKWAGPEVCTWSWSEHGPAAPKRLKALAREGIPAHLRPCLWLRFSGGLARQLAHGPGLLCQTWCTHPVLDR